MRTILFAVAALTFTGAAGAAEPTRLDAAQLDWITASTAAARVLQEARASGGDAVDGHGIVEAAQRELETLVGEGAAATAQPKPAGGTTVANLEDSRTVTSSGGGGTIAIISGTGPGTASAFASQTITSSSDGNGVPVVTTSTGGFSTGGLTGKAFTFGPAGSPATVPTVAPVTAPTTTVTIGSLTPLSSLDGFSGMSTMLTMPTMPTMPSFNLGGGG